MNKKAKNNPLCPACNEHQCNCLALIEGMSKAKTVEQLMRSRYVAYEQGKVDYIIATSSNQLKQSLDKHDIQQYCKKVNFIKLKVITATADSVEFIASIIDGNILYNLHEKSSFIIEDGAWKYDRGELFDTPERVINRNEACPCGSGKKFKRCHA